MKLDTIYIFSKDTLFVTEDTRGTTNSKVDVLLELAKSLKKHQEQIIGKNVKQLNEFL